MHIYINMLTCICICVNIHNVSLIIHSIHIFYLWCETIYLFFCLFSQKTISGFYSSIIHEVRAEPIYFRVGFYGGFPPFFKVRITWKSCDHVPSLTTLHFHVEQSVHFQRTWIWEITGLQCSYFSQFSSCQGKHKYSYT